MFNIIINLMKDKLMSDIADNVAATLTAVHELTAQVSNLATAVAAIQAPTVDLQPVLDAIAGVSAKLEPTAA
jgi:hypothetical protein